MNPDHFVKVFDVVDAGFHTWKFSAFGLIFVAIGLLMLAVPAALKAANIPLFDFGFSVNRFVRYVFPVFGVFWTVLVFWMTYSEHRRHTTLVQQNQCNVVEGPVENFVPMPYAGHARETFSVAGVPFSYSDFNVTDGFNNTSSHGGPISRDSYVRICYDPRDNVILRLEIRDFKGEVKDYSKSPLFPPADGAAAAGNAGPPIQLPWYSSAFVWLFLLDFIAIQMMVLPYYRMFFRIKTSPGGNYAVPLSLKADEKIKLRNSMICWHWEDHAIWLRPRGLNLFQVPGTIARLGLDETNRTIVETQIRFSSGATLTFGLFLWIGYQLFASVPVKGGPPPEVFVIFGLFIAFAIFFNLRMLRSRMQKLIDEAVGELAEM